MKIVTYRYISKAKGKDGLSVAYYSVTEEEHEDLKKRICLDDSIESSMREYVNEYDVDKIMKSETFKTSKTNNEEVVQ